MNKQTTETLMLTEFLQYLELELNRSKLTAAAYGRDLREMATFLGRDEEMEDAADITTADVRAWLADMARNGLSPRSLRRKTQAARAFFRWIQKLGEIRNNPAAEVQLAKIGRKLPEFVREQEMEELLDNPVHGGDPALNIRNKLIINILYSCGIRRDELSKITDADVDFYQKEIRVHGKRDKTRIIPVADELLADIKEWQTVRDGLYAFPSPAPLICSKRGKLSGRAIYEIVHKLLQDTGATHKSPHSLRHTFATSLLNSGAEINSVKELLGHSSLQSTQIYTHLSFADMKKAYDSAHPRSKH
ncbi:MAG: tyrosine-type recombinase/integrase [Muribaculaceae bacterium]|nr:tyrosine-type recombinase/integrase [Muribaculaceae bacterium]